MPLLRYWRFINFLNLLFYLAQHSILNGARNNIEHLNMAFIAGKPSH
ncbi:hypothetical protein ymoll0001_6300 [Yersinia mollaretii ATCC 43969]|uniref:Uncharacterized protein n=1 Tax=Yersinia mollaretii (strain ATCC 43969 / DSM 18520 / CIP 103324 / CNY 7263 / WAIP 204) TaxID=349967 RepID=A0ABM9Y688_YERMW|nr:hypothetical protein ymoll0001_6300 [Yersinia mollaretii ATCC 43969]